MENRMRSIQRKVRFDETENQYITKRIEQSPFSTFQNFARVILLTNSFTYIDYSALERLNNEVKRIGNNINQLTKMAHLFEEISAEDILDLQQTMSELSQLTHETLKNERKKERRI